MLNKCLSEKKALLITELGAIHNSQDRLAWIVKRGRAVEPLGEEMKRDEFLVPGCLARLWLIASYESPCCCFRCDSDSAIVKGVATLVCELYSGCSPGEIRSGDSCLRSLADVSSLLTPNRRNGLRALIQAIQSFASKNLDPADASLDHKP